MPNYDYKCDQCGHYFEIFQNISDLPLEECPQCKGKIRRLIKGGTGVIFKGSGFYATDNPKRGLKPARPHCGQDTPCCGKDTPCQDSPCHADQKKND